MLPRNQNTCQKNSAKDKNGHEKKQKNGAKHPYKGLIQ